MRKFFLFGGCEFGLDGAGQPVFLGRPPSLEPFLTGISERQNGLPAVARIGRATHQPSRLECRNRSAHRLGTDPFRPSESRHGRGSLPVQATDHTFLRPRQVAQTSLITESPFQVADRNPELGCQSQCLGSIHILTLAVMKLTYKVYLH